MLQFSVEYLGSVPVDGATTSLQDLQGPLKNLYGDFLSRKNVLTGQLAITAEGIRFEAPKLRLVNPFSTIAVWAAIKFVARGEECAFMPLISDPVREGVSSLWCGLYAHYEFFSFVKLAKRWFHQKLCQFRDASVNQRLLIMVKVCKLQIL